MGSRVSLTQKEEPTEIPVVLQQPSGWFLERKTVLYALLAIGASLAIGMLGYWWICGFSWSDAYLNATMILGGMGPVGEVKDLAGKIFSGTYALYCGVVFLVIIAFFVDRLLSRHLSPTGH